jgi:hypothetical protein
MPHDAGAHHVHIDVHQAARQVLLRVDPCGVVPVTMPPLALVERPPGEASDQLQAGGDLIAAALENQQMHGLLGYDASSLRVLA